MKIRSNENSARRRSGHVLARAAAFLLPALLLSGAHGAAITYTETLAGPDSGKLNGKSFSNAKIIFTFVSNTSDVVSFTTPIKGYEDLTGTASVEVISGSKTYTANFLTSDDIFVSVDDTNGGIGIGSDGKLPTSAGFPGDPVYPAGIVVPGIDYNLASDFSATGTALSCVGFPGPCMSPVALATTNGSSTGSFVLKSLSGDGTFTAEVKSVPEPGLLSLAALALVGVGLARRRRHDR